MSNLIDLYKDDTFPAGEVTEGMLLIVTDDEEGTIPDGITVIVTDLGSNCIDDPYCSNEDKKKCCCRDLSVEVADKNLKDKDGEILWTTACHCILHTLDGRRIVRDDKYIPRKREVVYE